MERVEACGIPGRVSGLALVRDQEEYAGYSVLSILSHLEELVVVDRDSSDGTMAILRAIEGSSEIGDRLRIGVDPRDATLDEAVYNDALRACTGEWIVLLGGGDVFDDLSAVRLGRLLRRASVHPTVQSIGLTRRSFAVRDSEMFSGDRIATIAVRNSVGLHVRSAVQGDEHRGLALFDAAGRSVGVDHPADHAALIDATLRVHSYDGMRRSVCGEDRSELHACGASLAEGHPDAFFTHDFREWMQDPRFVDPSKFGGQPAHLAKTVVLDAPAVPGVRPSGESAGVD